MHIFNEHTRFFLFYRGKHFLGEHLLGRGGQVIVCQLHVLRAIASQLYKVEIFLTQAGELNNRVEDWVGAVSRCDFLLTVKHVTFPLSLSRVSHLNPFFTFTFTGRRSRWKRPGIRRATKEGRTDWDFVRSSFFQWIISNIQYSHVMQPIKLIISNV